LGCGQWSEARKVKKKEEGEEVEERIQNSKLENENSDLPL
jgi:hypothetical protein